MSNNQLLGSSFQDGLLAPYYFNGRLLAAEDLKQDQDAMLARLGVLGNAVGYGIINGLLASGAKNTTTIQVSAGDGLNPAGQIIRLPDPVTLPLSPQSGTTATPTNTGKFGDCTLANIPSGGAINTGAYLLTVMPISRLEGQVAYKAAAGSTAPPGCASKWERDGLVFKAIRLTQFDMAGSAVTDKNVQNLLAHWCFGSTALQHSADDPFHFDNRYSGLDLIPNADLTECDLPLAVFVWKNGALQFVDAWSARRRLIRPGAWDDMPSAKLDGWRGLLRDKRIAEGEARFLQFQDQVNALAAAGNAGSVKATDCFRYLPPAGILPLSGMKGSRGFDYLKFFNNLTYRDPVFIEGAKVEHLIRCAFTYSPIDLGNSEMFWLYLVRENMQSIDNSTLSAPQAYLIFANGYIPYQGDAQFDLSRWNYSNYS